MTPSESSSLAPLALSTMWAQRWGEVADLSPFFEAAARMGFDRFELSPVVTRAALDRGLSRTRTVTALHHPCPGPEDRGASLTHRDPQVRRAALASLLATVKRAAGLGAEAVVLHVGRLGGGIDAVGNRLEFEVVSRYLAGQEKGSTFLAAREALMSHLHHTEGPDLDRAMDALATATAAARDAGLRLAFETGHDPLDLPTPAGAVTLLDALGESGLAAWLDTGHVGAQQHLGTASFAEWFDAVGDGWAGAHLHDVVALRDHLAPGTGDLDWAALIRRLPASALATMEMDWYLSEDEVVAGARQLLAAAGPHWTV